MEVILGEAGTSGKVKLGNKRLLSNKEI